MEEIINLDAVKFETPHAGTPGEPRRGNRYGVLVLIVIALGVIGLGYYYYTTHIASQDIQKVSEDAPAVPPTEAEKAAFTQDLDSRQADIAANDRVAMMQSLSNRPVIDAKDRSLTINK